MLSNRGVGTDLTVRDELIGLQAVILQAPSQGRADLEFRRRSFEAQLVGVRGYGRQAAPAPQERGPVAVPLALAEVSPLAPPPGARQPAGAAARVRPAPAAWPRPVAAPCAARQRLHGHSDDLAALAAPGLATEPFAGYLEAFASGLPPHSGCALGLERWVTRLFGARTCARQL
jgi:hypothetical protein